MSFPGEEPDIITSTQLDANPLECQSPDDEPCREILIQDSTTASGVNAESLSETASNAVAQPNVDADSQLAQLECLTARMDDQLRDFDIACNRYADCLTETLNKSKAYGQDLDWRLRAAEDAKYFIHTEYQEPGSRKSRSEETVADMTTSRQGQPAMEVIEIIE